MISQILFIVFSLLCCLTFQIECFRGVLMQAQNRIAEAMDCFQSAIEYRPSLASKKKHRLLYKNEYGRIDRGCLSQNDLYLFAECVPSIEKVFPFSSNFSIPFIYIVRLNFYTSFLFITTCF